MQFLLFITRYNFRSLMALTRHTDALLTACAGCLFHSAMADGNGEYLRVFRLHDLSCKIEINMNCRAVSVRPDRGSVARAPRRGKHEAARQRIFHSPVYLTRKGCPSKRAIIRSCCSRSECRRSNPQNARGKDEPLLRA